MRISLGDHGSRRGFFFFCYPSSYALLYLVTHLAIHEIIPRKPWTLIETVLEKVVTKRFPSPVEPVGINDQPPAPSLCI